VRARRLTTAQALIAFLAAQRVSRERTQVPLLAGMFDILGPGKLGESGRPSEHGGLRFIVPRNERDGAPAAPQLGAQ
jgi:TPP-dependent trihydroxycyclohexane-1,2-dione (THcHDO) dehydratase